MNCRKRQLPLAFVRASADEFEDGLKSYKRDDFDSAISAFRNAAAAASAPAQCMLVKYDPQARPAPNYEFDQRIAW
jgi:hypothetical protein